MAATHQQKIEVLTRASQTTFFSDIAKSVSGTHNNKFIQWKFEDVTSDLQRSVLGSSLHKAAVAFRNAYFELYGAEKAGEDEVSILTMREGKRVYIKAWVEFLSLSAEASSLGNKEDSLHKEKYYGRLNSFVQRVDDFLNQLSEKTLPGEYKNVSDALAGLREDLVKFRNDKYVERKKELQVLLEALGDVEKGAKVRTFRHPFSGDPVRMKEALILLPQIVDAIVGAPEKTNAEVTSIAETVRKTIEFQTQLDALLKSLNNVHMSLNRLTQAPKTETAKIVDPWAKGTVVAFLDVSEVPSKQKGIDAWWPGVSSEIKTLDQEIASLGLVAAPLEPVEHKKRSLVNGNLHVAAIQLSNGSNEQAVKDQLKKLVEKVKGTSFSLVDLTDLERGKPPTPRPKSLKEIASKPARALTPEEKKAIVGKAEQEHKVLKQQYDALAGALGKDEIQQLIFGNPSKENSTIALVGNSVESVGEAIRDKKIELGMLHETTVAVRGVREDTFSP